MDVTKLEHYLLINNELIKIEEPIGFDNLETIITRGELHGISAEVSVGSLDFYNNSADAIRNAYNTDIETKIEYFVKNENGIEIYRGVLDLSTYQEITGKYTQVSCKVGEIGVKTTFNIRTDTKIDLNGKNTIDGKPLSFNPNWLSLNLPLKHLRYTNLFKQTYTKTYTKYEEDNEEKDLRLIAGARQYILFPITKVVASEFGNTSNGGKIVVAQYGGNDGKVYNASKLYTIDDKEDFQEEFGKSPTATGDANISLKLQFKEPLIPSDHYQAEKVTISYGVGMTSGTDTYNNLSIGFGEMKTIEVSQGEIPVFDLECNISRNAQVFTNDGNSGYVFAIEIYTARNVNYISDAKFELTINKGTSFKMVMTDDLEDNKTLVDMLPIHEALNKISHTISENELLVRSEWYGRVDSQIDPVLFFGDGALKALTNGYKIRDLFAAEDTQRPMSISFADVMKDLNVIDCVGWGFSKEDDKLVVRVERWDWFYQDYIMIEINDPNEIKRSVTPDYIFNEISIGYNKYATSKEYNSIDSIFGERLFVSPIKSINNKKDLQCEFVADNYAIEETRRARYERNETEETSYDESIFIFELSCLIDWFNEESENFEIVEYEVVNNVVESEGVAREKEQLNVQLSPRRCLDRWKDFLFATNNTLPFTFLSSTINSDATFKCNLSHLIEGSWKQKQFLKDFAKGQNLSERQSVLYEKTKIKSELLEFSYPITITQFNIIRDNPYGIIRVNGEDCWLKEIKFKIATGDCEFKVIPINGQ